MLMQIKMVMVKKMAMVKLEMLVATTTTAVVISYMPVTMEVEVGILLVPAFRVNDCDRRGVNVVVSPLPKM